MSDTPRAELTGVEKAVSDTLDEVNFRMHGLTSSGSYHRQFIDWLGEHGYVVVSRAAMDRVRALAQELATAPHGELAPVRSVGGEVIAALDEDAAG